MEIKNKKAYYNYYIENEIETGIELKGTEIKSVRKGSVDLKDSYVRIKKDEVFLINTYIEKYREGNNFNHEPTRERKLLLHKSEIRRLKNNVSQEGFTLIPLKMYLKGSKVKVLIGLGKGKKNYDKREVIKKREMDRMRKERY